MRCIVVGLGVQGEKRAICAGKDYVSSVDPVNPKADFKKIQPFLDEFRNIISLRKLFSYKTQT